MVHDIARFADRETAGRRLGEALQQVVGREPIVVGLARGGMPVAAQVAQALNAPLDLLVVRKIGAPFQPELGLGALAEGDVQVIDSVLCEDLGISDAEVRRLVREHAAAFDQTAAAYRFAHPRQELTGREVIVVDDGLATGSTAHAAIRSVRRAGATRVILAVPVGSRESVHRLEDIADLVVCLSIPTHFLAVGQHYSRFDQVSNEDVIALLDAGSTTDVSIAVGEAELHGILVIPSRARLLVVFAHGSGSSRFSPRNHEVARLLNDSGIATLLVDLLTEEEAHDRDNVFDVEHLADRLEGVVAWTRTTPRTQHLGVALFGASTGAAAALAVAARCPDLVRSVVSRGGRPDLARHWLRLVKAPTLLIVGGDDVEVLRLNREALMRLQSPASLEIVAGASHLFEEPGTLKQAATLARDWFASTAISHAA